MHTLNVFKECNFFFLAKDIVMLFYENYMCAPDRFGYLPNTQWKLAFFDRAVEFFRQRHLFMAKGGIIDEEGVKTYLFESKRSCKEFRLIGKDNQFYELQMRKPGEDWSSPIIRNYLAFLAYVLENSRLDMEAVKRRGLSLRMRLSKAF